MPGVLHSEILDGSLQFVKCVLDTSWPIHQLSWVLTVMVVKILSEEGTHP